MCSQSRSKKPFQRQCYAVSDPFLNSKLPSRLFRRYLCNSILVVAVFVS